MSRCTDCAQFPCECGIQIGKCTCESTYAVTFCKDCGIGMTTDHDLLARIDAWKNSARNKETIWDEALDFANALSSVLAKCSQNGYTTWDKSMVPLIDGQYDEDAAKKWEAAHGHDIRMKCYPEFGCQLLIDPEDLIQAIEKELG